MSREVSRQGSRQRRAWASGPVARRVQLCPVARAPGRGLGSPPPLPWSRCEAGLTWMLWGVGGAENPLTRCSGQVSPNLGDSWGPSPEDCPGGPGGDPAERRPRGGAAPRPAEPWPRHVLRHRPVTRLGWQPPVHREPAPAPLKRQPPCERLRSLVFGLNCLDSPPSAGPAPGR